MKTFKCIVLLVALSGCHHQAPRVDCDKQLVPINPPAPAVKPNARPPSTP